MPRDELLERLKKGPYPRMDAGGARLLRTLVERGLAEAQAAITRPTRVAQRRQLGYARLRELARARG